MFAPLSRAQLLQDLFALWVNGTETQGQFLDVGAGDPEYLSNTFLLERFGWTGGLIDANADVEDASKRRATFIHRAAWREDEAELTFNLIGDCPELSRLQDVVPEDAQERSGQRASITEQRQVKTIRLKTALDQIGAGPRLSYLSLDIEGAELDLLKDFDFSRCIFNCITVEHNHTSHEAEIDALLASHGYRRVFASLSRWDGWYIHETVSRKNTDLIPQDCLPGLSSTMDAAIRLSSEEIAVSQIERAMQSQDLSLAQFISLGRRARQIDRTDLLRRLGRQAHRRFPKNPAAIAFQIDSLLESGPGFLDQARTLSDAALLARSHDPWIMTSSADCFLKEGRYAEAIRVADQLRSNLTSDFNALSKERKLRVLNIIETAAEAIEETGLVGDVRTDIQSLKA